MRKSSSQKELAELYRQGLLDWKKIATRRGARLRRINLKVAKMSRSKFAAVRIWADALSRVIKGEKETKG